jgi:Putative zinc-finger
MNIPGHDDESRHESVWLLLPWYANGTLEAGERREVDEHLAACSRCREELGRCGDLAAALRSTPESAPSPHPIQLARLVARIEAAEAAPLAAPPADPGEASSSGTAGVRWGGATRGREGAAMPAGGTGDKGAVRPARIGPRLRSLLIATPRPVRFTLAAQLAALLVLTALPFASRLGLHPVSPAASAAAGGASRTFYVTQSAGAEPVAMRPQIRVLFSEAATERQIREMLLRVRGRLVDGPSPLGTYTLEIPATPPAAPAGPAESEAGGATAPTAATARHQAHAGGPAEGPPDSLGIVLTYLRAQPIVRFAEPVAGLPGLATGGAGGAGATPPARRSPQP